VEGGVRTLPGAYVAALGELSTRYGALVIADEVQTGLCRTGPLLASSAWPRRPDVVVLAKALGGGLLPLSATLTTRDIFARAYGTIETADSHHYTFSGNALACVAGFATLDLLTDALAVRVQEVGDAFRRALAEALPR
jgi:acetylornithine/succinyldiaminopimelate/putrescine aminotransferase